MQSQPSRLTDNVFGPRWSVRPGGMLHPADRRMLQAVCDTLSHVRRPATSVTSTSTRHDVESTPVQSGVYVAGDGMTITSSQGCSRLNYNKKAMDEIRQSLQSYHVTPSYDSNSVLTTTHLANGGGNGIATSASDNMVRQVVLLGANEARNSSLLIEYCNLCSERCNILQCGLYSSLVCMAKSPWSLFGVVLCVCGRLT